MTKSKFANFENSSQTLKSDCNGWTIKNPETNRLNYFKGFFYATVFLNDKPLEVAYTYMYVVWPAESVEGFLLKIPYRTVGIIMSLGVWIIWHSINTTFFRQ